MGGSQIDLDTINFIDTEVVTLNKLQADFEGVAKLISPISETQIKLSHSNVITNIEVDKFTEGTIEVPVLIKNLPQNVSINYFPKYISVTYYLPLSDYGKFQASDFKIECDYMKSQNSDFTFMMAELVKIPKSVKKARLSSDKVEFIFLNDCGSLTGGIGSGKSTVAKLFLQTVFLFIILMMLQRN